MLDMTLTSLMSAPVAPLGDALDPAAAEPAVAPAATGGACPSKIPVRAGMTAAMQSVAAAVTLASPEPRPHAQRDH